MYLHLRQCPECKKNFKEEFFMKKKLAVLFYGVEAAVLISAPLQAEDHKDLEDITLCAASY